MYLLRKATTKPQGLKGAFIRMLTFFCPDPNKLLANEPVVAASELTMTKNKVDMLRMTFVAASSNSPKCSIATKKANHEATPINGLNMFQIDTRQT